MQLQILKMSFSSLRHNLVRSFLTALGIIIGTGIVVLMLSIGEGIKTLVLSQLSTITPETLYVEIQVPSSAKTRLEKDNNTANSLASGVQIKTLTLDDVEDLRSLQNVEKAYGMRIDQQKFSHLGNEKIAMIFAVESEYEEVENLQMKSGRFFTPIEDRALKNVIVLGSEVESILFDGASGLNKKVKINNVDYEVVGVADEQGSQFFLNMDEIVYLPIRTAQKKLMGEEYIQAISITMKNKTFIGPTINAIEKTIRRNHNITDPDKDDFVVRTMDEAMQIVNSVTGGISILLFSIACISLVVGGVGIMNIMYVAVSERTSEIGLKKAVGAKESAIKFQFLAESVTISLIGGVLGVLVGIFLSFIISVIAQNFGFNWPFVVNQSMVVFSSSIAISLGIIFGYGPASKAAKLDPILALRRR